MCIYHILFIHSSADGHLGCFYLLAIVNNAINTGIRISVQALRSTLLGIYLEPELVDHMIILYLTFWGTAKLFSTVPVPFYIPTNSSWGFQFLNIHTNTCYVPFSFFFSYYSHSSKYKVIFFCLLQWKNPNWPSRRLTSDWDLTGLYTY